jgi:hypothetical protein
LEPFLQGRIYSLLLIRTLFSRDEYILHFWLGILFFRNDPGNNIFSSPDLAGIIKKSVRKFSPGC